ncbi:glycosyltransferase family 4 protein [Zhouia spongiae]|uniref:Glycosyltransferase family 4 protein n=1 Tax=Zhouia spongiae TaxID=2202721 RepID=A0ABY3YJX8_9FLAO|nr:glycosyltransferase family 4 protein [Zhouia spongiae]UNY97888.1 glycosyltransferase family 4 protein [Zhouia spongiae]
MKCLHIANDYSGSKIYSNLFKHLDDNDFSQTVYTAIRRENLIDNNKIDFRNEKSQIYYRHILNIWTRVNFFHKKEKIFSDLLKELDNIESFDIIHAHTWFSDGAVAYELHKKYNIPYIIAVRSTDIKIFLKYFLHLRRYGIKILMNASKIIFISPSYRKMFIQNQFIKKRLKYFENKILIIPNGINQFWLNHINTKKSDYFGVFKILFIGTFIKRKNVHRLIKAVTNLNKSGFKCELLLVGGGGRYHYKILKLISKYSFIRYLGEVYDKNRLKDLLATSNLFAMPSYNETFGLVYAEALTQSTLIMYAQNDGVDGIYSEKTGVKINPFSVQSIESGILAIAENYKEYNFNPTEETKVNDWERIAKQYRNIYNFILNNDNS